ncbi:hypothetical protein ABH924_002467 [Arthrobacter sp. GAS37]
MGALTEGRRRIAARALFRRGFAAKLAPMRTEQRRNKKAVGAVLRANMMIVLVAALSLAASGCVADVPTIAGPTDPHKTAAPSTAGAGTGQSAATGQMPVGDLPGWRRVFGEDFSEGDVPLGGFPGPAYSAKWSVNYADGTPDTAGQQSGGRSGYYPSKVLSVKDGMLDMYLHTEKGVSMGAAPAPKLQPANGRPYDSLLYGRYSVRFRSEALQGFKTAWLLWPDSGVWPRDGEIDYPEGDLSKSFYGAVHQAGSDKNIFHENQSGARFTAWHTATTEWTPGRVEFFLDGVSIGVNAVGIPDKPMHYILQTESCLTGCPAPATAGHLQVAWVAIWAKG